MVGMGRQVQAVGCKPHTSGKAWGEWDWASQPGNLVSRLPLPCS